MRRPRRWGPVDVIALTLAAALGGLVWLILIATTVQIVHTGRGPEVELSDNATQVLVGATGALTGLLGGYLGSRHATRRREPPGPVDDQPDDLEG